MIHVLFTTGTARIYTGTFYSYSYFLQFDIFGFSFVLCGTWFSKTLKYKNFSLFWAWVVAKNMCFALWVHAGRPRPILGLLTKHKRFFANRPTQWSLLIQIYPNHWSIGKQKYVSWPLIGGGYLRSPYAQNKLHWYGSAYIVMRILFLSRVFPFFTRSQSDIPKITGS